MTAATRSEQSRRDLTKSSPMGYAVAQLAKAASLIFAVSVITFFLAKVTGFNPVDAYFGSELTASPEQRAALASKWGLDQPTMCSSVCGGGTSCTATWEPRWFSRGP